MDGERSWFSPGDRSRAADESAPPATISKMIHRVIEDKVNGERSTPSAMAGEVNETKKRLRQLVTPVPLRRAQPAGRPRLRPPRPQGKALPRGHLRQGAEAVTA
jgi:hypothetical protein